MKLCKSMPQSRGDRFAALFMGIPIVLSLIGFSIWLLSNAWSVKSFLIICLFLCIPFALVIKVFLPSILLESRRYQVDCNGIIVGGFLRKNRFYAWEQISEIGVYAFSANAAVDSFRSVICCFFQPKPEWFGQKMVKSYFYAANHMNEFVVIDYSSDVYAELSAAYPGSIEDYRSRQIRLFNSATYRKLKDHNNTNKSS